MLKTEIISANDARKLLVGHNRRRMQRLYKRLPELKKKPQKRKPPKIVMNPGILQVPDNDTVFIPYNVPSKKRAYKPIYRNGKLSMAKQMHITRYEMLTKRFYGQYVEWFRGKIVDLRPPYVVQLTFVRDNPKDRWDFNNLSAIITDQMVENGWVEDDNISTLLAVPPLDGSPRWHISSAAPGVFIKVLRIPAIHS